MCTFRWEQPFLMSEINLVLHAVDYMERQLSEPLVLEDVAREVGCSLFHFCRRFNQTAQYSPYAYLIRRRLSAAASALLSTDRKIIDLALDHGFQAPETFTRAFKRFYGMTPQDLRGQAYVDSRSLHAPLTRGYLEYLAQGEKSRPAIERLPSLNAFGVMIRMPRTPQALHDAWSSIYSQAKNKSAGKPVTVIGCMTYPRHWETLGVDYFVGVPSDELPRGASFPDGWSKHTIVGSRTVRTHPKATASFDLIWERLYRTCSDRMQLNLTSPPEVHKITFQQKSEQRVENMTFHVPLPQDDPLMAQ